MNTHLVIVMNGRDIRSHEAGNSLRKARKLADDMAHALPASATVALVDTDTMRRIVKELATPTKSTPI